MRYDQTINRSNATLVALGLATDQLQSVSHSSEKLLAPLLSLGTNISIHTKALQIQIQTRDLTSADQTCELLEHFFSLADTACDEINELLGKAQPS